MKNSASTVFAMQQVRYNACRSDVLTKAKGE